ncbi:MAG TPA: carboxypeptidase-like regulatory domain-containing protein, partial [Flavobacteriales bacterium]|nr:carboxypeptidase-like regulatory domain-containing protein [Flavobacteriales bacterium]
MSRIRIFLITITLILSGLVCAQSNVRLHGNVVNEATGEALAGVHVKLLKSDRGTTTDEQGNFEFLLVRGRSAVLEFSFVGYTTVQRNLSTSESEAGSKLVIALGSRMVELPAVTITRPGPEVVYQREDLHVGDYHANDQGLWVLTYERPQYWHRDSEVGAQVFREARLHLLDTNFVELCSVRIPGDAVRL